MTELPDLSSSHDLDPACVEQFRRDGHVAVRGLASAAEVAAYRPAIEAATHEFAFDKRPLEERDTYGKAFLQAANLWRRDQTVRRFTLARRFAEVAARLLEVDGVRLYHDQALFKEAGGGRTPWHQDQHYWPLDTDRTITMWMPLVDVPPSIGTMTFVSGSHRLGYLGEYAISDESDAAFARMIDERGLTCDTHGALVAGDATFHAGWILHSAPPNPTGTLRSVMTVIYYADGTRVSDPVGAGQEFDLRAWLRGLGPGDLAATDRNPLLFPSPEPSNGE